jgi:hypothetical protein
MPFLSQEHGNVTFLGKGTLKCDSMKYFEMERLSWISKMVLRCNHKVLLKGRQKKI